jgi:hypothetical protein
MLNYINVYRQIYLQLGSAERRVEALVSTRRRFPPTADVSRWRPFAAMACATKRDTRLLVVVHSAFLVA